MECREQKGRIISLTAQLSDLEETKTQLKQVNVRESKLQTRVSEQEAELEKQSTCWDQVKKAEQSLGKKQAEITRLENVDGDLVQQRAKEVSSDCCLSLVALTRLAGCFCSNLICKDAMIHYQYLQPTCHCITICSELASQYLTLLLLC